MLTHKYNKYQEGASAIEFAIALPLFLLVFYGIIYYATTFVYAQTLSSLSAEAARAAIAVHTDPNNPDASVNDINAHIENSVINPAWIKGITACNGYADYAGQNETESLLTVCLQIKAPLPKLPFIPEIEKLSSKSTLQLTL